MDKIWATIKSILQQIAHILGLNKMADIFQTTFTVYFSFMKITVLKVVPKGPIDKMM